MLPCGAGFQPATSEFVPPFFTLRCDTQAKPKERS